MIAKAVNISDKDKASQIPLIPIAFGNRIKQGIKNMNPRNRAKKAAGFYSLDTLIISYD